MERRKFVRGAGLAGGTVRGVERQVGVFVGDENQILARIRAALASTRGVHGATGDITLNAQRDAVKNAVILRITETGFRYHQTVEPQ